MNPIGLFLASRRRVLGLGAVALLIASAGYLYWPQVASWTMLKYRSTQAGVSENSVQVGANRWAYYEGGRGRTVVLLHGIASTKAVWLPVAAQLARHHRVIIPDLPGWGRSTAADGRGDSLDVQARRLAAFLRMLDVGQVTLVGHSMGGAIAGIYAVDEPAGVDRLVLVSTYGLPAKASPFARAVGAGDNPLLYSDEAGFNRAIAFAFETPRPVSPRIRRALVATNVAQFVRIKRSLAAMREPSQALSLHSRLPRLSLPVLAVWCGKDQIIDVSSLDALRKGLNGHLRAVVLDRCSHMPMMERADDVAREIAEFMRSSPIRSPAPSARASALSPPTSARP